MAKRSYKRHGMTQHPLYYTWANMKARCSNPKNTKYAFYGGKGIKVCEEWQNDFAQFLEDMGDRPSPRHTVDRIDNALGYSPANCRWATYEQQNNHLAKHRNNTSGHTGVSYDRRRGGWRAYIHNRSLGSYASLEEAVSVRQEAESCLVF